MNRRSSMIEWNDRATFLVWSLPINSWTRSTMNIYGDKLLTMRMIQIKSNKKQVLLLMINAFLEAFEFEAGVSVIRIAPPWFLSCTTHCKFTSLVPPLYHSCTTIVSLVVFRSGRALGASGHGVKRSWLGALTMPPAGRNTKLLIRNSFQFLKMEVFLPLFAG